jgi:hypothetical protein
MSMSQALPPDSYTTTTPLHCSAIMKASVRVGVQGGSLVGLRDVAGMGTATAHALHRGSASAVRGCLS